MFLYNGDFMECQKEKILAESKVLLLFLKLTLKVNEVVLKISSM